nr:protein PFC0760c-like [Lytechinus pictus]
MEFVSNRISQDEPKCRTTRTRTDKETKKRWSRVEKEELIFCFYVATKLNTTKTRNYRRSMRNLWLLNNEDPNVSEQALADMKHSIFRSKYFTDSQLHHVKLRAKIYLTEQGNQVNILNRKVGGASDDDNDNDDDNVDLTEAVNDDNGVADDNNARNKDNNDGHGEDVDNDAGNDETKDDHGDGDNKNAGPNDANDVYIDADYKNAGDDVAYDDHREADDNNANVNETKVGKSKILHTQSLHSKVKRKRERKLWSNKEKENLMTCFYFATDVSHKTRHYRKRMRETWLENNGDPSVGEQALADMKQSILRTQYFSEIELERIKQKAHILCREVNNAGNDDTSDDHGDGDDKNAGPDNANDGHRYADDKNAGDGDANGDHDNEDDNENHDGDDNNVGVDDFNDDHDDADNNITSDDDTNDVLGDAEVNNIGKDDATDDRAEANNDEADNDNVAIIDNHGDVVKNHKAVDDDDADTDAKEIELERIKQKAHILCRKIDNAGNDETSDDHGDSDDKNAGPDNANDGHRYAHDKNAVYGDANGDHGNEDDNENHDGDDNNVGVDDFNDGHDDADNNDTGDDDTNDDLGDAEVNNAGKPNDDANDDHAEANNDEADNDNVAINDNHGDVVNNDTADDDYDADIDGENVYHKGRNEGGQPNKDGRVETCDKRLSRHPPKDNDTTWPANYNENSKITDTQSLHSKVRRKREKKLWSNKEKENLMTCFYFATDVSHKTRHYRKRMRETWLENNGDPSVGEQALADMKQSILRTQYFSEIELERIKQKAHILCREVNNAGNDDTIDDHGDAKDSDHDNAGTGDTNNGPDDNADVVDANEDHGDSDDKNADDDVIEDHNDADDKNTGDDDAYEIYGHSDYNSANGDEAKVGKSMSLDTRSLHNKVRRKGEKKLWSNKEKENLMTCFYFATDVSHKTRHYRKRMRETWLVNNGDPSVGEEGLVDMKQSIISTQYFSDIELERIKENAQSLCRERKRNATKNQDDRGKRITDKVDKLHDTNNDRERSGKGENSVITNTEKVRNSIHDEGSTVSGNTVNISLDEGIIFNNQQDVRTQSDRGLRDGEHNQKNITRTTYESS